MSRELTLAGGATDEFFKTFTDNVSFILTLTPKQKVDDSSNQLSIKLLLNYEMTIFFLQYSLYFYKTNTKIQNKLNNELIKTTDEKLVLKFLNSILYTNLLLYNCN